MQASIINGPLYCAGTNLHVLVNNNNKCMLKTYLFAHITPSYILITIFSSNISNYFQNTLN